MKRKTLVQPSSSCSLSPFPFLLPLLEKKKKQNGPTLYQNGLPKEIMAIVMDFILFLNIIECEKVCRAWKSYNLFKNWRLSLKVLEMNRFPPLSPLLAFHLADKATMCDHLISNLSTLSLLVEEASLKDVSFLFIKKIKIMGNHWVESRCRHEWGNQFPRVFPNLVSVSINDFPQNLGLEFFKFPLASLEWKRKNINATSEKPLVKALRVALRELTRFSGKILKISLPISKIDVKKWNHSWNLLLNMPHLEELEIEITSHENQEKCLSFWSKIQGNGNGN